MSPTMLADDVAMSLLQQRAEWKNREHFFAIATRLMLRLITDYQRKRLALKRGAGERGDDVLDADTPASITAESGDIAEAGAAAVEALPVQHAVQPRHARGDALARDLVVQRHRRDRQHREAAVADEEGVLVGAVARAAVLHHPHAPRRELVVDAVIQKEHAVRDVLLEAVPGQAARAALDLGRWHGL